MKNDPHPMPPVTLEIYHVPAHTVTGLPLDPKDRSRWSTRAPFLFLRWGIAGGRLLVHALSLN